MFSKHRGTCLQMPTPLRWYRHWELLDRFWTTFWHTFLTGQSSVQFWSEIPHTNTSTLNKKGKNTFSFFLLFSFNLTKKKQNIFLLSDEMEKWRRMPKEISNQKKQCFNIKVCILLSATKFLFLFSCEKKSRKLFLFPASTMIY